MESVIVRGVIECGVSCSVCSYCVSGCLCWDVVVNMRFLDNEWFGLVEFVC